MPNFRLQRFARGDDLRLLMPNDEIPEAGWAIRLPDGEVFVDGVQIGHRGSFHNEAVLEDPGNYYAHVEYVPLSKD